MGRPPITPGVVWVGLDPLVCRSFRSACSGAQVLHVTARTFWSSRFAPVSPDFPTRQVHHSGKLRVQSLCLVDHLFYGGIGGAETKAGNALEAVSLGLDRVSARLSQFRIRRGLQKVIGGLGMADCSDDTDTRSTVLHGTQYLSRQTDLSHRYGIPHFLLPRAYCTQDNRRRTRSLTSDSVPHFVGPIERSERPSLGSNLVLYCILAHLHQFSQDGILIQLMTKIFDALQIL